MDRCEKKDGRFNEIIGTVCFTGVNSEKLRFKIVDKATYYGKTELD